MIGLIRCYHCDAPLFKMSGEETPSNVTPLQKRTEEVAQKAPDGSACPKCNGPMWDNRATRKGKQPDYRCKAGKYNPATKSIDGCDGAIWLDREEA